MSVARVELRGLDPLLRALRRLEKRDAKKALRTGMRKGANLVRKEARKRAPKRSGGYAKSLKAKSLKPRPDESVAYKVGPGKGGRHGVLIERGTDERTHASGKSTGRMPAFHVLAEAFQATKGEAEKAFRSEIEKAVSKVR